MDQQRRAFWEDKLANGTDAEKNHARARLAQTDAIPGEPAKQSYPSVVDMAAKATKAMAGWAKSGFATVSDEEKSRRLAICHECKYFDFKQYRCYLCGCACNWKARLLTEKCPIDKW